MKQINVHIGIVSPKNRHVISAHSPEPVNKSLITDPIGKFSNINDKPGPQAGTSSAGKFCNHTCLADTKTPKKEISVINTVITVLKIFLGG